MIQKYSLEFILHTQKLSCRTIKTSLSEFGEVLAISNCKDSDTDTTDFKININTEDPTVIFDICAEFGRIMSVKVEEVK